MITQRPQQPSFEFMPRQISHAVVVNPQINFVTQYNSNITCGLDRLYREEEILQ